jgi:hypothetical protein
MKVKIPLFSRELTVATSLSPREIARRLEKQVEKPGFGWPSGQHLFEGNVQGTTFRIWRAVRFQKNPFLPIITGSIDPTEDGARIRVSLRPAFGLLIMLVLLCAMLVFQLSLALPRAFKGDGVGISIFLGCDLLIYTIIFAFTYITFQEEADRAMKLLKKLVIAA